MTSVRIKKLRQKFAENNIDGYIIPKNDEYFGEYSYPDKLKFISNFDGSAGLALVLHKINYLFVDGRYTIQANLQSGKLFKIIEIHKKPPWKIIKKKITIGYDPYCFNSLNLFRYFKNNFHLKPIYNELINLKKIDKKNSKFYLLNKNIIGESSKNKINKVLTFLKKDQSDYLFITAPENVAWIFNIRGKDNPHSPLPNCRALINKNGNIFLFTDKSKTLNIIKDKNFRKIKILDESKINYILYKLKAEKIIIDKLSCSIAYENILKSRAKISQRNDPIYNFKSIKNEIEIKNIENSHILDGVAVIKFLNWFKKCKSRLTELKAEKKLEYFRKKNKKYLNSSFKTISASGPNGAIIHYRATKKSNRTIKKDDIYLCDSGGQYKYGTTDVTRTICLKKQPQKIKNVFTRVLKGHVAVKEANLNKIKDASKLDKLARKYLNKKKLDYPHGTGHGVGFFLNVHEGPIAISRGYKKRIEPGQVLSNEPGYYKEGSYGIRIENLIYVNKMKNKVFFKNLTMVPIEKDLINYKLLNKTEKNYLLNYNLEIYEKLQKYLNYEEKFWLLSQF